MTSDWWFAASMYSYYQFGFVVLVTLFPSLFPSKFIDTVRASTVLVACGWLLLYVAVGPAQIAAFYQRIFPQVPKEIVYTLDIIVHFIPVMIVGLPIEKYSYFIAFAMLLVWYLVFRPMTQKVHGYVIRRTADWIFFVAGPIAVLLLSLGHIRTLKK